MELATSWVVVSGNIFDGLTLYGPFATYDLALYWANGLWNTEWLITALEQPDEQKEEDEYHG